MKIQPLAALIAACLFTLSTAGEIKTKEITYQDGATKLTGFLAWDSELVKGEDVSLPGVLIVHQWMGLTDYEKGRAKQLAKLGYVVFALDIYGTDHAPTDFGTAGAASGRFKNDRKLFRKRLNLGLTQLTKQTHAIVDAKRVAAIGYCFGGTGVLELARSGAEVAGVVSFHGGLDSAGEDGGKHIKAKVLILHGEDDPFVPVEGIDAMKKEFNKAEVDWQMISYSNTVHSFTQPMAGDKPELGYAYNEKADFRSWLHMQSFFFETIDQPEKK